MTFRRWQDLTTVEFEALDRETTVAVMPLGAIEQHGPHLPVSTDAVIAEEMAARAPERPYGNLIPIPGRGIVAVSATTMVLDAGSGSARICRVASTRPTNSIDGLTSMRTTSATVTAGGGASGSVASCSHATRASSEPSSGKPDLIPRRPMVDAPMTAFPGSLASMTR